jgi:hypothetical protein
MKKNVSRFFFFVLIIASIILLIGQSSGIVPIPRMDGFGYGINPHLFNPVNPPSTNLLDLPGAGVGGVAFANIAVPLGFADGKPLSLRYNPSKKDGERLEVLIGDIVTNSGLYDWELVPLARFANGDSWACASLVGGATENDSLSVFENALEMCQLTVENIEAFREVVILFHQLGRTLLEDANNNNTIRNLVQIQRFEKEKDNLSLKDQESFDKFKNVLWASYNPALGNTFVGLNLLLVDAMFVSCNHGSQVMNRILSIVNDFPKIPGYNDTPIEKTVPSNELLSELNQDWSTYIFSDFRLPIYYWVNGNKIVFSSFPYYQFMKYANGKYGYLESLNNYIRFNYPAIKALNPVLFNAAEKWCHWSALFRAIKGKSGAEWSSFFNSVNATYPYFPDDPEKTRYPEPICQTPRFWVY